ncbi:MAG: hypothetical protein ACK5SY_00340 [bacterium]|jgi:hypothetical protein
MVSLSPLQAKFSKITMTPEQIQRLRDNNWILDDPQGVSDKELDWIQSVLALREYYEETGRELTQSNIDWINTFLLSNYDEGVVDPPPEQLELPQEQT